MFKDLLQIFFPYRCIHCLKIVEQLNLYLCGNCLISLQETAFTHYINNPLEKLLHGRANIQRATALYEYHKNEPIQTLLKNLKYQNHQNIGFETGCILASLLLNSIDFSDIDYIVPVPLHHKKEKKRGYNQVDLFGKALADKLKAVYLKDFLIRNTFTTTQTQKNKLERIKNVKNKFTCNNNYHFKNKNVLIIDDVITTGATIEVCVNVIHQHHHVKVYVAAIACALYQ